MAKTIHVGLYKVICRPQGETTIPDIIATVNALPDNETRAFMLADEPIRPRRLELNQDHCFADFVRIRLVNEMDLADVRGQEDVIHFTPEGLHPAEKTAFVYDNESGVLFLQEGRGITAASLARYFKSVGRLDSVQALPVLKLDALERFQRQRRFTLFKVKLAGLDNATLLRELGLTNHELIRMAHQYRAPTATVQLQLDRRDEGSLRSVLETVTALLPLPRKNLKSMLVKGGEEGEEEFLVDFIRDRMVYSVPLDTGEEPTDAQRYNAVLGAWQEHRTELRNRFRANAA